MLTSMIQPFKVGYSGRLILRNIHSSCINKNASQSPLFKLRQKTGLAYNLCREALNKHENNLEEAEAWLKAQAMVHGSIKATKVAGRSTREGLIGLAINQSNTTATMLELNCETDFVARNQMFKDLVIDLTQRVASSGSGPETIGDSIEEIKLNQEQLKDLEADIVPVITKLSENIRIQRALRFNSLDIAIRLFAQVHAKTGHKSSEDLDIMAGRFGALVGLKINPSSLDCNHIKGIGNRLCQHVIGYSPTYIELPEKIRRHLEEEEKKQLEKADLPDTGEVEDDYSDSEEIEPKRNSRDEWPSIMDQTLIMSETTSVREFCLNSEVSIVYFSRFECSGDT